MPSENSNTVDVTFVIENPQSPGGTSGRVQAAGVKGRSLLDIATACDVDIEHACGGVGACATCHVYIEQGMDSLSEAGEDEEDRLDEAPGVRPNSRLSCLCRIVGSGPIVVKVPAWNRNAVKETE